MRPPANPEVNQRMITRWTVRNTVPNNGIKRVHLNHDDGAPDQQSDIHVNATSKAVPETFMLGDVWGVTFTLIYRPGTNGPRQENTI